MDVVMLISWSHYYNRRGMFMIEKLEEYGRFLFGWAFRAMQSEMTMQESLNAKSERAYLTGTEIALLEDSSLFIIGIGILVLMEAFFVVVVISLLLHGVMELIIRCLVEGYSFLTREKRSRQRAAARRIQKRQEALLLQYVLESEERTKEMPDVLNMRINLHVIVIGAGLTGSFFLKEMIAYLHMKQENLIRTDITVFDPGSIGKEDLGAVYIREDLGQNRALLLSELLKEQYDYEVTAVPGDFSVGSPVLQISKRDYVFMVDCSDGSIPGDYRTEWKKLSAKRKLYLKFADAKLYLDDGSGTEPFFSNTEEKSEDFVWKHLERMFLVNLAMSKIVAVYEEGQIECGTFCVNEKMAQIRPQHHNDQKLDLPMGRKPTEVFHYQLVVVGTGGTGSYYLKELGAILSSLTKEERNSYALSIIDGDRVEQKNLDRQNFLKEDVGQHKAMVLAQALRDHYGIEVRAYPMYIDSAEQLKVVFKQMTGTYYRRTVPILIGSVDNHRARQEMEKWFRQTPTGIWIDAANEFHTGEVVAAVKKNGKMLSPSRPYYFPEIMRSREKRASELSCGVINQSSPQHRFTNMAAAMLALSATLGILRYGFLPYKIVYFDVFKGNAIPVNAGAERGIFFEDSE